MRYIYTFRFKGCYLGATAIVVAKTEEEARDAVYRDCQIGHDTAMALMALAWFLSNCSRTKSAPARVRVLLCLPLVGNLARISRIAAAIAPWDPAVSIISANACAGFSLRDLVNLG